MACLIFFLLRAFMLTLEVVFGLGNQLLQAVYCKRCADLIKTNSTLSQFFLFLLVFAFATLKLDPESLSTRLLKILFSRRGFVCWLFLSLV